MPQRNVKRAMELNDMWDEEWAAAWQQHQQELQRQQGVQQQAQSMQQDDGERTQQVLCATKYKAAVFSDGHRGKSVLYRLSQTRDGSNVLVYYDKPSGEQEPQIGQVQYYLKVDCRVAGESATPSQSDAADQEEGDVAEPDGSSSHSSIRTAVFAVMKHYKPASHAVTRLQADQVAEVLFESRIDDFVSSAAAPSGVLFVVPLDRIHAPVHVHRSEVGQQFRLTLVPLLGRSKRVLCKRPA